MRSEHVEFCRFQRESPMHACVKASIKPLMYSNRKIWNAKAAKTKQHQVAVKRRKMHSKVMVA
jgi:phosphatidylserine/phosphatidylglycerophosphate/cardiolipin synthase-like enzyme